MTLDEQTGAKLLEDILAGPHDDAARLIYADWLEEFGGDEFQAGFVRWAVRLKRPHAVVYARQGVLRLHWRAGGGRYPRGFADWVRRTLPRPAAARAELRFRYGTLDAVQCGLGWWREHGPRLVRRHPLRAVTPVGRRPHEFQGHAYWYGGGGDETIPYYLPYEVFSLMPPSGPNGRRFANANSAWIAVSDALLSWARGRPA